MEEIAICSICSKKAVGKKDIEAMFGYRLVLNIPMSRCKECQQLGSTCDNLKCEKWGQNYPKCFYEIGCPKN